MKRRKWQRKSPETKIELTLILAASVRNKETETVIVKSLHAHFRLFAHAFVNERKKLNQRGILMTVCGFVLMITTL